MAHNEMHPIVTCRFELPSIRPISDQSKQKLLELEATTASLPHRVPDHLLPQELRGGKDAECTVEVQDPESTSDELAERVYRSPDWHVDGRSRVEDMRVEILTTRHSTMYASGVLRVCSGYLLRQWREISEREPGRKMPVAWYPDTVLEALSETEGYYWVEKLIEGDHDDVNEYASFTGATIMSAEPFTIQSGLIQKTLHKSARVPDGQPIVPRVFYRSFLEP